jgi:hypothetical protein
MTTGDTQIGPHGNDARGYPGAARPTVEPKPSARPRLIPEPPFTLRTYTRQKRHALFLIAGGGASGGVPCVEVGGLLPVGEVGASNIRSAAA